MFGIVDLVFICLFTAIYAWTFYNLPIIAAGVRNARKKKVKGKTPAVVDGRVLPSFSIIVPAKNEGKMIDRLFNALSRLAWCRKLASIVSCASVIFASIWMSPSSVIHFNVMLSLFSAKPNHRSSPNHLPRRFETNW